MRRASVCEVQRCFAKHSHSSVEKKRSAIALSSASLREPMDGRTPSVWQRCPKANALYWRPLIRVMHDIGGAPLPRRHVERVEDDRGLQRIAYRASPSR